MKRDNYENIIIKFFCDMVCCPGEKVFSFFNPDVPLHRGQKAAYFSVDRVKRAWQEWKSANDISYRESWSEVSKRVFERVPTKQERKTRKLKECKQRIPRDRIEFQSEQDTEKRGVKKCVLIDKEEVLNMAREVLRDETFNFEDVQEITQEIQDQQCVFRSF